MGVYGYADDISLLCPTVSGMKEMLKTCETFAKQHDILFNASKSLLLWFVLYWTRRNTDLIVDVHLFTHKLW